VLGHAIRELLIEGADFDYLERHAQGLDKLRAAVERFTLERASAVAGVDPEMLQAFVADIRRAGRLSVETGTGVTMQRAGNVTGWLSLALMAVTGSLDREGGSWVNPGRIMRKDKADFEAAPEEGWNRPGPASRPELRGTHGDFPCAAIPDEIAAGNLRAMAVFGGNLEVCLPETARSFGALQQLEVLAVFDVRRNRTVDIATHVLPTKGQLERSDMSFVTDSAFPLLITQYTPALVEPLGQRKAFWWILGELGLRMGIDFFPGFDHANGTDDLFLAFILNMFGHDFADLKKRRLIADPPVVGWVQRFVDEKVGGWRLAPKLLAEQLAALEARESEQEPATLILIPRRQKYHENSKLIELRDPPRVFMNSSDAAKQGLVEGALVRVRSANGKVERPLKIDDTLRPGSINVPHGWSDGMNVNNLTSTTREVDPITGMLLYSGLEVLVEAVASQAQEGR
jgi:anaerobic selenocysteine-containing dehydrogenase